MDAVDAVTEWTQYTVDIVCSGCSTQWNSGIWWWEHCLWCKKVKPVDSVDAVTDWTQYTVDTVCSGCSMQWNSGIWWWVPCL